MEILTEKIDLNNLDKSNWEIFKFDEIAQKISKTIDPNETTLETYVGLEHINGGDIHIRSKGSTNDVKGGKLRCYPGDVIFGKRRAYLRKAAIVDFDGICSAHAFVLRANQEVIDSKLFPFFLHSNQFMHRMVDISVGGLSPTINWGDLRHQEFLLPPKDQQNQLVKLLSAMDDLVEGNLKVHSKLILLNKSTKKKLLTPQEMENWEFKSLSELFTKITQKNKENITDNVLTISAEHGLISQEEYFNRRVSSKNISNYYILETGDFAYNKSYSNGYPAGAIKVQHRYELGVVSPLYICFRPAQKGLHNSYYEHLFDMGYLNQQILSVAKEGARNHGLLNVAGGDFFNLKVPLPALSYLKKVIPVINTLDVNICKSDSIISKSKSLQKSLINQIF